VFTAVTLRVALFTPAPALTASLLLGLLGALLASRPAVMAAIAATAAALPPPPAAGGASSPSPLLRGATLSRHVTLAVGAAVFVLSGLLEIGGGWLVWRYVRNAAPRYYAFFGAAALVAYGFVAALQPMADFGRAYALYGGYFVLMSVGWGAALDGFKPDVGDAVGCALIAAGVAVMTAWPRGHV
jgi:small multidrug resistance family-3 protein